MNKSDVESLLKSLGIDPSQVEAIAVDKEGLLWQLLKKAEPALVMDMLVKLAQLGVDDLDSSLALKVIPGITRPVVDRVMRSYLDAFERCRDAIRAANREVETSLASRN
jgi:hypothetical protein